MATTFSARTPMRGFFAATGATALLTLGGASAGAQLTLGANSRGYVSANQVQTAPCTVGAFGSVGGPTIFSAGNATIDCGFAGWNGQSLMESSARTLRSLTRVTVTDPSGVDLNALPSSNGARTLTALARTVYLDRMFIDPNGAIPDSARFNYTLSGSLDNSPGANTSTNPTANFTIGWDSEFAPGFPQGTVMAPGQYSFAFAILPSMIGRAISFSTALQTFANLFPVDPAGRIFGEAITDYGNTLTLDALQFLQASGSGAGVDVTGSVAASFATGTDYVTPMSTVPEPTTWVMLGSGLLALGGIASRRRRVAA
jgi:hypothetical protein